MKGISELYEIDGVLCRVSDGISASIVSFQGEEEIVVETPNGVNAEDLSVIKKIKEIKKKVVIPKFFNPWGEYPFFKKIPREKEENKNPWEAGIKYVSEYEIGGTKSTLDGYTSFVSIGIPKENDQNIEVEMYFELSFVGRRRYTINDFNQLSINNLKQVFSK